MAEAPPPWEDEALPDDEAPVAHSPDHSTWKDLGVKFPLLVFPGHSTPSLLHQSCLKAEMNTISWRELTELELTAQEDMAKLMNYDIPQMVCSPPSQPPTAS